MINSIHACVVSCSIYDRHHQSLHSVKWESPSEQSQSPGPRFCWRTITKMVSVMAQLAQIAIFVMVSVMAQLAQIVVFVMVSVMTQLAQIVIFVMVSVMTQLVQIAIFVMVSVMAQLV